MKIAILIDQLVPGGVQKSAIQEAKELKKMGHKVAIFVLVKLDYQYQYHDLTRGLKVIFLSEYNPWPFKRAFFFPYFAFLTHLHLLNPFFAERYKVLLGFDYIISHGTTTCITAKAISKKLDIPYLAFIWDPMAYILEKVYSPTPLRYLFPILKPLTRFYEKSFLTSASLIATSSKVHQQFIKENYQINPLIIHPGCFPPKKVPKKTDKCILAYTRWELAKNPRLFLWLAKKLPQTKFLIAGTWTDRQEEELFVTNIKKNKLERQIELISPITKKDLVKIASRGLIWIHPNFEAFGMAGLEMAAMGLPILIPKRSGVTELFEDKKHGYFFSTSNKQQLLDFIKELLSSPEATIQMGKQAAKRAKNYTWKYHTDKVLKSISTNRSQIKVLCLANAFVSTRSIGGGDRFLIELSRLLPQTIQFTVILPSPGYYHWQRAGVEKPNIRYIVLKPNRFDNIDRPISLFIAYLIRTFQTVSIYRQLPNFQVIHTSTDLVPDTIPAYFLKRSNSQIPWTARFFHFIEHPLKRKGRLWVNIGSFLLQQLSIELLKKANIIMTDNLTVNERLVEKGIEPGRIKLHTGGVDINYIQAIKAKKTYQSDAVFVGRLQPHKGIFDLIDVWDKVVKSRPKAKLIIIGHSTAEIVKQITQRINKKHLQKNIILTGYIDDRKKLITYLRSTRLLLFLDYEAGFGLIVAEAMAAGIPTVAYKLPIFGSIYKKGFRSVPMGNTEKFSHEVITLLRNKDQYNELKKQTHLQARQLDWSRASKSFNKRLIRLSRNKITNI